MVLNCRSSGERPTVALNGLLAGLTLQNPALRLKIPAFRLQTKPNRTDTHELPINRSAVSVLVIISHGSPAHLHFAQNSIFLNAAMQRFFGSAVRPPNLPADHSAEQPDHCEVNPSDYVAPSQSIHARRSAMCDFCAAQHRVTATTDLHWRRMSYIHTGTWAEDQIPS